MKKTKLEMTEAVSHFAHHYVHLTYLGLVFFESHGIYGIAAGVLGVVVIIEGTVDHIIHKGK